MKKLNALCVKSTARAVLLAFALCGITAPARSAEIFYMDHDLLTSRYSGPVGPLVISGEIEPGDYDRLLAKIGADRERFLAQNHILLASNGGDMLETLKIARFIQALFTKVSVAPQTGPCVGACFLLYAAAAERATDGEHLLGLHRPTLLEAVSASLSPAAARELDERALAQVRAFLSANDVPEALVTQMFAHSSDVYWLSVADEQALGTLSAAFHRHLVSRCGWDDALERGVQSGTRPFDAALPMLKCRAQSTPVEARKALNTLIR